MCSCVGHTPCALPPLLYVEGLPSAAGLAVRPEAAGDGLAVTPEDVQRYGLAAPTADDSTSEEVTEGDVARLGLRAPAADDSSPEQLVTQGDVDKYGLAAPRGSRADGQVRSRRRAARAPWPAPRRRRVRPRGLRAGGGGESRGAWAGGPGGVSVRPGPCGPPRRSVTTFLREMRRAALAGQVTVSEADVRFYGLEAPAAGGDELVPVTAGDVDKYGLRNLTAHRMYALDKHAV